MTSGRNRVRIIGGQWRSRVLRFPAAAPLRPTPDRVRETLFNWLGQRLDGLRCLDLFAGSGALGFEALSRGAASVVLVEKDREVARALQASAQALDAKGAEVVVGDAFDYLQRAPRGSFDVAFVDPPYASGLASVAMDKLPAVLAPGARVYLETADAPQPGERWRVLRAERAGAVRYGLYELVP
jgi:16S rRNA (guanine966-N2)-methyltransferase